jgi:hypothetical protein
MTDAVNHPDHYTQGDIECIDAIRAALTAEEFRGYCKGNVLKYVWRERHKGQNEALGKCIPHLNWAIEADRSPSLLAITDEVERRQ